MPRGPRGERRPEDPAQAAVMVVRLATGEIEEKLDETTTNEHPVMRQPKNAAAVELGRLGGKKGGRARADKLSTERRVEIAKQAASARWKGNV